MDYEVKHDEAEHIFFADVDGVRAYAEYVRTDSALDITHTIVPKEIGGRGIAACLVQAAYDYARQNGLRPVGTCAYAAVWLKRHPEYLAD